VIKRRFRCRRLLLGVALAALVAVPAAAGADVRILSVDTSGFPALRATLIAPAGTTSPQLRENGHAVAGYSAVNLGKEKAIILALDRSQSMRGRPLANALAAASAFVSAAGAQDHVGVVAFGRSAYGLTRTSAAPADARAALESLAVDAASGTALYDAIVVAAAQLQHDDRPGRAIVVVTDGRDVSSTHSLDDAVAAAHAARASVYAIGIGGPSFTPDALQRLARETGGSYRQASTAAALGAVYAALADELSRTWQLSYLTSARPGAHVHLAASVPGSGSAAADVVIAATGGSSTDAASGLIPAIGYSAGGTLVIGLICGLLVLLAAGLCLASRRGGRLRSRIEPHLAAQPGTSKARRRQDGAAARAQVSDTVERMLGELRQFKRLQARIERADLPLRAGELLALCGGLAFFFGLVAAVAASSVLVILLTMVVVGSLPLGFVALKATARIKKFENQLPDLLITIAASLKAGHSFRQGIQAVVDEGADPAAKEFRRVMTETQLGKPMDDALADMAERIDSKNLSFVITAVTIQRQIGGSLAGLFDMVADTVRQRQQFMRKVRGLTAMGRMSAYVLVGLPFFIAVVVTLMNPLYMWPLYHTSTGHKLIATGVGMLLVGSLMLKKTVSFKG
jgi:tight adherence protein B